MVNPIIRSLTPLARFYSLGFLHEKNIERSQTALLSKKLRSLSRTTIGRELGAPSKEIQGMPITTYEFYRKYYENPSEGDFMYPLSEYLLATTSGTMGRPKKYLIPKPAVIDNMMKTGLSMTIISSHDGDRYTFEFGDVIYTNAPGGNFISAHNVELGGKKTSAFIKQVPDPNLSFREKVDYFVKNHESIDYAYMTVPTLLDTVYPRIGEPFHLKGFMTQDSSAAVLKDEIKAVTGNYPKVTYGSTEALASTLPSVEHPGGFFFDWRICYVELIPEENKVPVDAVRVDESPETVYFMDAEAGRRYQVVVTPFKADLTRYAMPDILECVDTGDSVLGSDSTVFKYYSRSDRLIVLHNFTRTSEEEILQVLSDAGIPFVDFVARKEREGSREYMVLYLELSAPMAEQEVYDKVNRGLTDFDRDWRDLVDFMEYVPLKLRLLPRGSFSRYLEAKEGMPRVDRMEMRDELLDRLLGKRETA